MSYNSEMSKRAAGQHREDELTIVSYCVYALPKDSAAVTAELAPDDIGDYDARMGFECVLRLLRAGEAVSLFTFMAEMRSAGAESSAEQVLEMPGQILQRGDAKAIVRRIKTGAARRRLKSAIDAASKSLEEGEETQHVLEAMLASLSSSSRASGRVTKLSDALRSRADELEKPTVPGLMSPWLGLNEYWGELEPGEVVVIGARPKVGKTALTLQLAQHISTTYGPGLVVSLEMTARELCDRVLRFQLGIAGRIGAGHAAAARALAERLEATGLFVVDGPQTGASLEQSARSFVARTPAARWLVVDYLQLLGRAKGDPDSAYQLVTDNVNRIKNLAMELGLVVFLVAQLNRLAANEEPQMHHLRDSGAIEQAANKIALLWADDAGRVILNTAGNRSGPVGPAMLRFTPAKMTFTDWNETPTKRSVTHTGRIAPLMGRVEMEEMPLGNF